MGEDREESKVRDRTVCGVDLFIFPVSSRSETEIETRNENQMGETNEKSSRRNQDHTSVERVHARLLPAERYDADAGARVRAEELPADAREDVRVPRRWQPARQG